jgi:hypothetical protein
MDLPQDIFYKVTIEIEDPMDFLNTCSASKSSLGMCDHYNLWKKHAKKTMKIDIPNSKKIYTEYAVKNKIVNEFLENQDLPSNIRSFTLLLENSKSDLLSEIERLERVVLYESPVNWKLLDKIGEYKDFYRQIDRKTDVILSESNPIEKKYKLYLLIESVLQKFVELSDY